MNKFLIKCGKLYDGIKDELQEHMEIYVVGNTIDKVGKNIKIDDDVKVIDLSHTTVTPGLIDAHIHPDLYDMNVTPLATLVSNQDYVTMTSYNMNQILRRGFTSLRAMGTASTDFTVHSLARMEKRGLVVGPRIYPANILSVHGGHGDLKGQFLSSNPVIADYHRIEEAVALGEDGFTKHVRKEIAYGSTFIKLIYSGGFATPNDDPTQRQISIKEATAAIDAAHSLHKGVTAHCYPTELIDELIEIGIDGIEHGSFMNEKTAKAMEKNNIYLVPTFLPFDQALHGTKEDFERLNKPFQQKLIKHKDDIARGREVIKNSSIRLGFGSDIVNQWHVWEIWREFSVWVKMGISPWRTLRALTMENARIIGAEDTIGSIEPGKLADISAWTTDILKDPNALKECEFVMKNGIEYRTIKNETAIK